MTTDKNKLFDFKNPPANYGEVSFFWWHGDDITKEKLSWILEQLKDKHICGLQINYCHGNSGGRQWGLTMKSDPKPFTDDWWELVKWFVVECKKYGMSVSLSDYTLAAPGQEYFMDWVIAEHPEMIGQQLIMTDGTVTVEKVPYSISPMAKGVGDAYVEKFYGAFERQISDECGKGINYFFSDELQFNVRGNLWCDDFKEEFMARKGYDITQKWNAIFEDIGPETPKIRLDYYDIIVQLSEERYFKIIYDWHEQRGMTFGCDHGGRGKDITEFGDYFRAMKWNQGPGNDQPSMRSDIIKSKCSASIAHMYRRPRVWLEGFYGSGWATGCDDVADATFRNFALGHNLLSLHGLYYSTHGSMWEWAPPCNHHHMPYWEQMGNFLECTKRLSYLIAQGTHRCDIAIIYPVAAAEADTEQGKRAANTAFETAKHLYSHGTDFDFIDFESIQRATVENGELCVSGERFKTIIVPEMNAVRFGMMEKLREFAVAGGQVLFGKCIPTASDRIGSDDEMLNDLVNEILKTGCITHSLEEVSAKIKEHNPVSDFDCGIENAFFQHRIIEGKDYYLLYRIPKGTLIRLRTKGYPVLLDPWSGEKYRLDSFQSSTAYGETVTEISMPLSSKEMFVVMFETEHDTRASIPLYTPFSDDDELITMDGEWACKLIPTMNNKYGDWRLPAFDGFIGAEAREMEYCYCDNADEIPENAIWKRSCYSYGTYFYLAEGEVDEGKLIAATQPTDEMKEYRFSIKYGVEGDAGAQNSYHGLKGLLSDEFLVMGDKKLTYANSSSVYEGEGPYYFFTTVYTDEAITAQIETGEYTPDKIWIDHAEVSEKKIMLTKGRHYVLLRFPHGGRSYFVLRKDHSFKRTLPLVTNWFENTDILRFDAFPESNGKYCCCRFKSPVGAKVMRVNAKTRVKAYVNEKELAAVGFNVFEIDTPSSAEVILFARQSIGEYDTAVLTDPITFETEDGVYDMNISPDEQGLNFYSGGIALTKSICLTRTDKRQFLSVNDDFGCAFEVYVNGNKAATLLTSPYRCDITQYVRDGENKIEVVAFNDLHNHMKTIPTNYNRRVEQEQ